MDKYSAVVTALTFAGAMEAHSCHEGSQRLEKAPHTHRTPEAAAVCGARMLRGLTLSAGHRRDARTRYLELDSQVAYQDKSGGAWLRFSIAHGLRSY